MALKLKLTNGTILEYVEAREEPMYYGNATRRCLTFYFDPAKAPLAEVNTLASNDANIASLTLTNDNDPKSIITNIYDDYVYKIKVSQEPVTRGIDPSTGGEKRVENVILVLGQLTPVEKQLRALGIKV